MKKNSIQEIPAVLTGLENEIISDSNNKTNLEKLIESKKIISKSRKSIQIDEKKSAELIRRLKIASLIITIIAGLGSIIYYIFSLINGNTMILRPADTVIINGSDLQFDQKQDDADNEKTVINKLMELQDKNQNSIPVNYFVGKITAIDDNSQNDIGVNQISEKIQLKIQKTYDIADKNRVNDSIDCQIDSANSSFFQKWQEFDFNNIDRPGRIKIKVDDLIGFRYTKKKGTNLCELFQINNVNFQEFKSARIKLIQNLFDPILSNMVSLSGRIEEFSEGKFVTGGFLLNPMTVERSPMIFEKYNSGAIFNKYYDPIFYDKNPIILHVTTYFKNNQLYPLLNISCQLEYQNITALANFFRRSSIAPIEEKDRISIEINLYGGYGEQGNIGKISPWDGYSLSPDNSKYLETLYFSKCGLKKIELYDMEHINVIDYYRFGG